MLTLHEVVILCDLFGCTAFLNIGKESHEDVFRKRTDVCLCKSICQPNFSWKLLVYSQCLSVDLDKEDSFDRNGGVRVNDII